MPSEFSIIRHYFSPSVERSDVILGIGDDAAILRIPEGYELVQSVDTLVSGVHFPEETSPQDIAYKALAVNLSDMAAMGAEPSWFTLAITLPNDNEEWLKAFSESLSSLSKKHNVQLIGGDTTCGPLCISITINGFVPVGKSLTRYNAKVSDKIYVSGTLGDAALALLEWQGQCLLNEASVDYLKNKLNRPEPKIELGLLLRDYASACIDISDGLLSDLGHIANKSNVGASINFSHIPRSNEFDSNLTDNDLIMPLVLSGGDDYELCFTIPTDKQREFELTVNKNNLSVTCIGEIESEQGIRCMHNDKEINLMQMGYQHFSN